MGKELRAWQDQFKQDSEMQVGGQPAMSHFERMAVSERLEAVREDLKPRLYRQAMGEFRSQYGRYQKAKTRMFEAEKRWINSFDPVKLDAEISIAQKRIQAAFSLPDEEIPKRLELLRQMAVLSADPVKQMALAEASGMVEEPKEMDHARALNHFRQSAERDKAALKKNAPEYQRALKDAEAQANALYQIRQDVLELASIWEDAQPFNESHEMGLNPVWHPRELKDLDLVEKEPRTGDLRVYDEEVPDGQPAGA